MRRWICYAAGLGLAGSSLAAGQPAEEPESIWNFLLGKYDADTDGSVSVEEYGRQGEKFERLDRNGDGALTAADFERGRSGMTMDPKTLAGMVVSRYLAEGEDLDATKLSAAFAAFDADDDARLTRDEFDVEAEARGASPGMDRFQMLVDVIGDGDDVLTLPEFVAWFTDRDVDTDGVLSGSEMGVTRGRFGRSGPSRGERSEDENAPDDPARVGAVAPDFALKPVHGGDAVTLSSFAGKRPVALIFGSYT